MVNQGQNVQLSIIMPEILSDGEWKWSDGSTGPAITLDNIQTSGTYSVVYTMKTGETLNFDYEILVTEKEDRMLEVADYYIIDRASNRYLTNVGGLGTSPVLAEKDETAPLKQIWNITRSTTARYDILSRLDGSGIDKSGVLRNRTFKVYRLQGAAGTMFFAIHNSATSGNIYWTIDDNGNIVYEGAPSLYGYPFELVKTTYYADGIDGVKEDGKTSVAEVTYYDTNGTRIAQPRSGISIRKQRMTDGTVITEKIITK